MNIQTFYILPVILLLASSAVSCAPASSGTTENTAANTMTYTTAANGVTNTFDEQALAGRAADYVSEFQNGNFETVFTDADKTLAAGCSAEDLSQSWTSLLNDARGFRSQEVPEVSAAANGLQVVVNSIHARYRICSTFVFNDEGKVSDVAFTLEPLIVEPESGDNWYETTVDVGYDKEKPLNGMLTLPRNIEKPPVVILVQGSGRNNMDSLIGEADNRFFADLAHGLADLGVASLRYDKRSYAYPDDVTDIQTEYLYDVRAAVGFIQEDKRVDGERLYLAGHSQGGMLSPKLISENPEFKGLISMGGTLRRMEELILEQNEVMNARNNQLTPDEKKAADAAIASLVEKIKALDSEAEASPKALLYGYPETYWKSLNEIDNLALAEKLAAENFPMLILQGGNDFQVTFDTDFALWQETVAGSTNATCIAYEGLSHVFMPGGPDFDPAVYNPPAHVKAEVIQDIADWANSR